MKKEPKRGSAKESKKIARDKATRQLIRDYMKEVINGLETILNEMEKYD